ncbi:MAG: DUF3426 domain-containing protein [Gammaproteobacteria bacterium]|jgi:predicted Zn finger-like uncharacterized protein|nr:DUF3426 domain-containing protein [Gammaproteobacteria bacterium]
MQTHCPQCGTQFRVTETQINSADGYVRCSVCEEVFNVYEVSDKTSLEEDHQHSLLNSCSADKNSPDIDIDSSETVISDESQKDKFGFFDKGNSELMEYVVPEEFREFHTSNLHSTASTILWGIGFLLLTTTLLIEYIWFNRDQFIQVPEIQAEIEKLCQVFECEDLSIRDPSKIELISRNIYSHPNEKNALMVNVTMKNNTGFSQPYPVMNIKFTDIRGSIVASRHFLPNEYLPLEYQHSDNKQQDLLLPDTSTSVTLEIQDPGKKAISYEFNFL